MDAEIRPVSVGEVDAFLRATPLIAGQPIWEPEPAAWWAGPGIGPAFGISPGDERLDSYRSELWEIERTQAAFVAGKLVGTAAVLTIELTIPGSSPVAMGGITAVGVLATHRRQGLMRAMLRAAVDDCHARGEFLAGLCASEGGVYGRFGFGPATLQVRWELERSRARLAQSPDEYYRGRLELVDGATAEAACSRLHDRAGRARVGDVSAYRGFWHLLTTDENRAGDGTGSKLFVLHRTTDGEPDGVAVYRSPWSDDPAISGTVYVDWLEAASEDAYTGLWAFLTDLDLTKRVIAARRPVDEVLQWQLADPRALRVTRLSDNLWLRLIDVPEALAARSYQVVGSLVLQVSDPFCLWNDGCWSLEGGPGGGTCGRAPAGAAPDLALDASALGSLYLGGIAPGTLVRAGLLRELVPGALERATAMLALPEPPHTAIGF